MQEIMYCFFQESENNAKKGGKKEKVLSRNSGICDNIINNVH